MNVFKKLAMGADFLSMTPKVAKNGWINGLKNSVSENPLEITIGKWL